MSLYFSDGKVFSMLFDHLCSPLDILGVLPNSETTTCLCWIPTAGDLKIEIFALLTSVRRSIFDLHNEKLARFLGVSFAWVQLVQLHTQFWEFSHILNSIYTHRFSSKQSLSKWVRIYTHTLLLPLTPLMLLFESKSIDVMRSCWNINLKVLFTGGFLLITKILTCISQET